MLLRVEHLTTRFETPAGAFNAVDDVSFEIDRGQTLALVGESGSGKSQTGLALLNLVPPPGQIVHGRVLLDGEDIRQMTPTRLRAIRGGRVAVVFQEPMSSLNPLLTIGRQIDEVLEVHTALTRSDRRRRICELLERVGIAEPDARRRAYPHELSGGMRQRVAIAMALAGEPELLIADEPTTALDLTLQAQVLNLLKELQRERGMGMLFVTHDLGVVATMADRVAVMYAGRIVEQAPVRAVLTTPRHPYTQALLACSLDTSRAAALRGGVLPIIGGELPGPLDRPPGCAFHPRCRVGNALTRCRIERPGVEAVAPSHEAACWEADRS